MISSYWAHILCQIHKFSEDLSIAIQIDNLSTIIHNNFSINNLQLILKNILVRKQIKLCSMSHVFVETKCVVILASVCMFLFCVIVKLYCSHSVWKCCLNSLVLGRNTKTTEIKGNLFCRKCGIYIKKISCVTYVSHGISGTLNWYVFSCCTMFHEKKSGYPECILP